MFVSRYVCACLSVCLRPRVCVCMHACVWCASRVCAHAGTCMRVCMCVCVSVCVCIGSGCRGMLDNKSVYINTMCFDASCI